MTLDRAKGFILVSLAPVDVGFASDTRSIQNVSASAVRNVVNKRLANLKAPMTISDAMNPAACDENVRWLIRHSRNQTCTVACKTKCPKKTSRNVKESQISTGVACVCRALPRIVKECGPSE